MDQSTRNTLRNVVTQCRRLLEESVAQVLQGQFGIYAAGKKDEVQIEPEARMSHLSDEDRAYRQDLLDHYEHIKALGYKPKDALAQLIREVAFTHLNRFCAYRMLESRGLIRESVSKGLKSQGFLFYLADHEEDERRFNSGQQDIAYRHFLNWLGGTLSEEIGVLFAPTDPANRLYPPQRVIDQVLGLLNDPELAGIWSEDEAIGWVYQYFTPKELRDQARKESQAPRNSYELAFRNQFFTPRYVVEFLTDNTLGRIWYEMRQGDTRLKDQCRYMVRRPTEVFLKDGETKSKDAGTAKDELSQEELLKLPVYVPFRGKKDPRELRILDPACGSGHFLLYCFDLLLTIYEEAYGDPDLVPALKKDYPTLEDLRRDMPRLILAHNLHGIDIDPRASQIAALALWLRCQRAHQELGIRQDRPKINRSNIVCAEPMPGEERMLKEFVAQLEPKVLGQVVEVVFEKMKLAGEAGSLLKIEEEIRDAVAAAKKHYAQETTHATDCRGHSLLFSEAEMGRLSTTPKQESLFDVSDITDASFFEQAEKRVTDALSTYAEQAQSGQRLSRSLFAEDAVRGFAFIDTCQKRYDVVLMNPPFGEFTLHTRHMANAQYAAKSHEILAAMVERGCLFLSSDGLLGAITSRTAFFAPTTAKWRQDIVLPAGVLVWAELGSGVLDGAMVETCMFALGKAPPPSIFMRPIRHTSGEIIPLESAKEFHLDAERFRLLEATPFSYWLGEHFFKCLQEIPDLAESNIFIKVGLQTGDDFRFIRLAAEAPSGDIPAIWRHHAKGGDNSPFYADLHLVVNWHHDGAAIKDHPSVRLNMYAPSQKKFHFEHGLTFSYRTHRFSPAALPAACITGVAGMGVFSFTHDPATLLALLNSSPVNEFISARLGQLESQSLYQAGTISPTPCPELTAIAAERLAALAEKAHSIIRASFMRDELSPLHVAIAPIDLEKDPAPDTHDACDTLLTIYDEIDEIALDAYGFRRGQADDIIVRWRETFRTAIIALLMRQHSPQADVLSLAVGHVYGRWDVRRALGPHPELMGMFDPLPSLPPGMLTTADGLPCSRTPDAYPLRVDWDGIVVDEQGNQDDVVHRVQDVLSVIWGSRAESIEKAVCLALAIDELRDYFRKPGKGGFWDDHISRYSKSRRKAPIYWLLQSSKKNYAIWLYYHRLDKDILFKALVNYVEPKLRLEDDRLESLRAHKSEGGNGKATKKLDKEIEKQEDFLSELRDFEEKLRRAAELRLVPDLNDGVVLNIAPLHEMVPWKEAERYWEELLEGKYEWSSIGKQLREKGLVK